MIRSYEIFETEDGSRSVQLQGSSVRFHSTRGAVQESLVVFLKNGLEFFMQEHPGIKPIVVLEVGFGTGLNAVLTAKTAIEKKRKVVYDTIDLYPLPPEIYENLNYDRVLQMPGHHQLMMQSSWEQELAIDDCFMLKKIKADLTTFAPARKYDLIYFDAFAPDDQEEMWTQEICSKMYKSLNNSGVLVTYCSKSMVRKRLQNAGLRIEKLSGPPGKREVIRAIKQ